MTRVLVTGFEPFAQDTYNPSWAAAQLLQDNPPDGVEVTAVQLPCVFGKSLTVLREAVLDSDPALVVSLGLSPRDCISVERVAINVNDCPIPDNAGRKPVDEPIVPDAPAAYFSTLPIKRCVTEVQKRTGLNSAVSQTAGTFVCNHVFYGLMHLLATEGKQRRGGFVHIPHTPEMPAAANHFVPSLPVEDTAKGLRVVLSTALAHDTDLAVAAGATH
ncbi:MULTISPECIES: pyroglutamyl-peptidase I [Streptomyces]|uniref:pyroglutamyl-peptidase I n=1 Tax=Streptomyces TaxID=1883 RepID=UPI00287FAC78|nr:pyroglutamyl-peptidase I [Streptomyces sp. CGMCC 4.1456]WNF66300.1 pyroglutamyl-peptidase I [Streptomyces sp. CGMCC 4.1456]